MRPSFCFPSLLIHAVRLPPPARLRPRHHDRARPPHRRSYSLREASLWASGMPLGGQVVVWPRCSRPAAACAAHLLSTTFPVCPLPRHRAPPVYLYPVPQVDSRACDGKAVTSRKTSWTAETAPGYHHHHHPHPCLPRDCELAESLLNSDPSPPWPKNHSQTIQ